MVLSDTDFLVVQTIAMRLNEKESLRWLASHGSKIKRAQFYRIKAKLSSLKHKKSNTHPDDFLEVGLRSKLEQLETIFYMSFQNARKEKDPSKNQKILESIVTMMPYATSMYEEFTLLQKNPHLMDKYSTDVNSYIEELGDY
ncbi:MAG: hypothetical protein KGZ37_09235 [Nitrosarchaeum sp.]|nr:hypothetical protein [Nitrosarchaeum sp.]